MKKNHCLIITSNGRNTFTEEQLAQLEEQYHTRYETVNREISEEEFVDLCRDAEYLAITRRPLKLLSEKTLSALARLKAMAIYSTGFEWLDVEHLKQREVLLSFLPDYSAITVAEHTLAMLLTLSRRIHLTMGRAAGEIPQHISVRGWELRDKQVGIVGLGRIGQEIARLLGAFDARTAYYDTQRIDTDVAYKPFPQLLSESDVIILAASSCQRRRAIITAAELQQMKASAFIVNPARASLVDNMAIIAALKEGRIAGYAVDDTVEYFNRDHGLDYGRIVQTAHTAWYSTEAIERGTDQWVQNIVSLASEQPLNLVYQP